MSLCKLKGESFKTKIEEDLKIGQIEGNTSLFLPITHILKSSADYRCIAKDGINDVPTKAAESITSMFKDTTPASVINGLGGLVTDAIKIITGSKMNIHYIHAVLMVQESYPLLLGSI